MKGKFRYILFPFAAVYGAIVKLRNRLYDRGVLHSVGFDLPVISVGNLTTGGTGKTPMVEYLIGLLKPSFRIATLSRGYKRKTKGFVLAGGDVHADDIGDEPMQFFMKNSDIRVAVCEDRLVAIPRILHLAPETQVVILDDAFQHRTVRPGLSILLTVWSDLYTHDHFLPFGNLRDSRKSSLRADIIVVTKCKTELSISQKEELIRELAAEPSQKIFFTTLKYGAPYHLVEKTTRRLGNTSTVLLVSGIAKPAPVIAALKTEIADVRTMLFRDHHRFSREDIKRMKHLFKLLDSPDKIIITTEKDAVKLTDYKHELKDLPIYVLPVGHSFLFGEEDSFRKTVIEFVENKLRDWKETSEGSGNTP